jgi:oligopeptide/dipeptide ABC transporter ATP-binding protein
MPAPLPKASAEAAAAAPLLRCRDLEVAFDDGRGGVVPVLRGVDLEVRRGEVLAVVGESGCGKTLAALAMLRLLPPGARVLGGRVELEGEGDLLALPEARMRRVRGRRVAMIFQEPSTALNPVLSIGFQICEVLRLHRGLDRGAARREAARLLDAVALSDAESRLRSYPHQLSGGQLQRVMIAMALAASPDLLLADEPTTALDVTVQAQVIDLLLDLKEDFGLTVLLITHDLGLVAESSDRVAVMYTGRVVEEATVEALFARPAHPYTRGLMAAVPRLGATSPPVAIPGQVPEPGELPTGCAFHPRCSEVMPECRGEEPGLRSVGPDHRGRCYLVPAGGGSA